MSAWWVRTEEAFGAASKWHGPFADVEAAQRAAAQLTKPTEAEDPFAEVVHGPRGGKGVRIREFYRGIDYLPGESGRYPSRPSARLDIPPDAGP